VEPAGGSDSIENGATPVGRYLVSKAKRILIREARKDAECGSL
jgi:hypothetical protein